MLFIKLAKVLSMWVKQIRPKLGVVTVYIGMYVIRVIRKWKRSSHACCVHAFKIKWFAVWNTCARTDIGKTKYNNT